MKLVINVILVVFAFTWTLGVSAQTEFRKQSPESFMTCAAGNGDSIKALSVPAIINKDQCPKFVQDPSCADCIISLENQGCRLIDVVVTQQLIPDGSNVASTTYLLSCANP